jgi:hypothetical protein
MTELEASFNIQDVLYVLLKISCRTPSYTKTYTLGTLTGKKRFSQHKSTFNFFILSLFFFRFQIVFSHSLFQSFPNAVITVAFFHCKSHYKVIFFSIFTCGFESQLRIHETARQRFPVADFLSVTVACGVISSS